jgi:general secretion pathway protein D
MSRWFLAILLGFAAVVSAAEDQSQAPAQPQAAQQQIVPTQPQAGVPVHAEAALAPCPENAKGGAACEPTKNDLKQAKSAFEKGMKLQKNQKLDDAFPEFENAAKLAPKNVEYMTAREMARQQLVYNHIERGNSALLKNDTMVAMAEFHDALLLDPDNAFAQQRMHDALGDQVPHVHSPPTIIARSGEMFVQPRAVHSDFKYRGDSRGLLTQVAAAYGIKVNIDDSVPSRQVRFEVTDLDFYTAMNLACTVTKTFWAPLQSDQIILALDTPENHKLFDRMVMRTFYFPDSDNPQEITDISNLLRTFFDIRSTNPQPQNRTIVVRAPQEAMDAATKILDSLDDSRPQVMLDVHIYEISHTFMRNMGIHIPNQFQLFNIPAGALAALGGQNIQQLINQLIASGGINQANSQSLSALLAQLQNQQNSIFSQPLATFGGGLTLMGLSLDTLSAQLQLNDNYSSSLEHAMLRVSQGNDTTFRMGSRYPILNASFAPVFNTPAIAGVIQNNSFQAPFPSFNYEDIGLSLKAKPVVNDGSVVTMNLEMQFKTLLTQTINGIPVIANREYKGTISLMDGEPAVVAGSVSHNEQKSLSGIPGLGFVPALNQVMTTNTKEIDDDELLVVITPHIVSDPNHSQNSEVWLPR